MKKFFEFIKKLKHKDKYKTCFVVEECLYHSNFRPIGFMFDEEKVKQFIKLKTQKYHEYRYFKLERIK